MTIPITGPIITLPIEEIIDLFNEKDRERFAERQRQIDVSSR